ncbi:hypothetical protein 8014-B2_0013 [Lactobacillus phage ATCC 8014-B2]|uniref:Uncharacterized protein n=1 Tax=Lactobacillus phage ATCC 8014-B2 TaxID=1225795 RepID=K4I4B0_9CAUD|nr:hypothetical protein HOQ89_gp013 [Lactobacillus phage ATCC 8014-B2]AFU63080.1 hypothetical protein 8014-B2_0013 [Lactobacillus phage ATCC 8014-B2]
MRSPDATSGHPLTVNTNSKLLLFPLPLGPYTILKKRGKYCRFFVNLNTIFPAQKKYF